jgi:lipopolysaccharide transport system ATP-binding protein
MSDVAIRVENLGKKFYIGHQRSGELRTSFSNSLRNLLGRSNGMTEEFWALKAISFEVKPGEAVGIIGRNGAGKSTLLKILSRITEPTTGRFEINGRVSSLLEVGTGFHHELTGRENIYLNGTILGMKRREIKAKFDEIVDFSGVEKFLDTPVKHYSSGMRVRLAFSVAAHLEPEILIIDEVLAVGDAEFQKKCLGKMDEVSKKEGRTVLFVSHNMGAVQNLCSKGILLKDGTITSIDSSENVVKKYFETTRPPDFRINTLPGSGSRTIQFDKMELYSQSKLIEIREGKVQVNYLRDIEFRLHLHAQNHQIDKVYVAITVKDSQGVKLMTLDNLYVNQPFSFHEADDIKVFCYIDSMRLNPGVYSLDIWCSNGYETYHKIEDVIELEILDTDTLGSGRIQHAHKHGFFYQAHKWTQTNN